MNIDIHSLKNKLMRLARLGKDKDAGITRPAYTAQYDEARDFVKSPF